MDEESIKKNICVVTATRAEYGLLKPLIQKLKLSSKFTVNVAVTGMHLSPEFGLTYKEIENDWIEIDKKIEILLSADTPSAISKSMGMAMIGFADYFAEIQFDAVILLGDRYEALAVACASMNAGIPIVHLYGGETTEGAVDEGIRHAITKLSYLHLTSTECYRRRVIQMGEDPERVFCVGALGVENVLKTTCLSKLEMTDFFDIKRDRKYGLVTFHPVTLENNSAEGQMKELLAALDEFPDWYFIITKANADKDGRVVNKLVDQYYLEHENVRVYESLGTLRYLSAMKYCEMLIGNSSSGLVEAPSFGIPTINIGDRQRGRIRAESVIDSAPKRQAIIDAMKAADEIVFRRGLGNVVNPYGNGGTSDTIINILSEVLYYGRVDLKKKFYDLDW
ncbi:MAG: UDP-N-acetylglucosamine 2-epimerase [Enterocloster sp.]